MLYQKGNYKYQLKKDEIFDDVGIYPDTDIITHFIHLYRDGRLVVKKGYAWDGPSGPTIDTDSFMRGSLGHDALYQLMRQRLLDRKYKAESDILLRDACLEDGMWKIRVWWVYKGVVFGGDPSTDPRNAKKILTAP